MSEGSVPTPLSSWMVALYGWGVLGVVVLLLPQPAIVGWTFIVVGAGWVGYGVWGWLGRSAWARSWAHGLPWEKNNVLGLTPGVGLLLLAVGPVRVGLESSAYMRLGGVMALCAFVLAGLGFFTPRWWGPRWYRTLATAEREAKPGNALSALIRAAMYEPDARSTERAGRKFPSEPLARWRGGWVQDPDANRRVHPMSRKGTVDGFLTVYEEGLTFAASRHEDVLRGQPTVLRIPADTIMHITTVPARAGTNGVARKGWLYRSVWPRLVVHTRSGGYVFEINFNRAAQAAELISAGTGRPGDNPSRSNRH